MAAKQTASSGFAESLLKLLFNNTTFSTVSQGIVPGGITTLYVSLHTSSPTASGTQASSEAAYGSYARVAVTRSTAGWVVTANSLSPAANITFPTAASGSETETFFGVGSGSTGATPLWYFGSISPTIVVSAAITPILTSSSTITET